MCSGTPSMTWLELVPIMVACLVWGRRWAGRQVCILCCGKANRAWKYKAAELQYVLW